MTGEEKEKILKMHEEGMRFADISRETGIPAATVSSFFRRAAARKDDRCPQCGRRIKQDPRYKRRRFCSDDCRLRWWHAHQEEMDRQAFYTAVCQWCGKEFITYGNDHRKYCSRECYGMSRRKSHA